MKKSTAILSLAFVALLGTIAFTMIELVDARRRIETLETQPRAAAANDNPDTAAAQLTRTIDGLQVQLAKANAGNRRSQVMAAQRAKDDLNPQREAASNRVMVAAWSPSDVVERLKRSGMKIETSAPQWRTDANTQPSSTQSPPSWQSWGLLCKPHDGDSFLVIRLEKTEPQRRDIALTTCRGAVLVPYQWSSFVFGFASDVQRDKVLAALPKIE
jgi:hypothetical protein